MQYVDTSAFLKLLVAEEHSEAFAAAVSDAVLWSSQLLAVEAHRAALRLSVPTDDVDALLATVSLVLPAATTLHRAQSVGQAELRALDALHLASALEIGPELAGVFTYDRRLAVACDAVGLVVEAPGREGAWWR